MDKNLKKIIEYPKTGIFSKVIYKNKTIDCTLFCLAAGAEISEHTSTKPGFVYIIEGHGTFKLAGRNIAMGAGVLIYMEKNLVHSLKVKRNTSFLLILMAEKIS